jgi:hypothetical protein
MAAKGVTAITRFTYSMREFNKVKFLTGWHISEQKVAPLCNPFRGG